MVSIIFKHMMKSMKGSFLHSKSRSIFFLLSLTLFTKIKWQQFIFLCYTFFQKPHSKINSYTYRAKDSTENNLVEIHYKYGFPINQAEDDSEEDCEVPTELARFF